jgi:hypothetical protein
MFSDKVIAVIAEAIKSELAHPLSAMRICRHPRRKWLSRSSNALDEAGST